MENLVPAPRVSEVTGIKTGTLAQWRHLGKGPRWYKLENAVRYSLPEVMEWVEQNAQDTKKEVI